MIRRAGNEGRAKITQSKTVLIGAHQGGSATIGKQHKGQSDFNIVRLLQMQGAKLQIDHQYARRGVCQHSGLGDAQRRNGSRAAHEADENAL